MFNWRKFSVVALSSLVLGELAVPSFAEDGPGNGAIVRPARGTWNSGWFESAVFNKALTKLGYDVQAPVTLDVQIFFTALAAGEVDFWPHAFISQHLAYIKPGMELVGNTITGQAIGGYLIDKATADKYSITSFTDLQKPEIAKLFDRDGDGKADMAACPPGWGCEVTIDYQIEAFGLKDSVTPLKASYESMMADIIARYKAGEPVLFFTWTPNWTVDVLKPGKDVIWLEVPHPDLPPEEESLEPDTIVPDVVGCAHNPCKMPHAAATIRAVFRAGFLEQHPVVRRLFEVASIPIVDVTAQNAKMNAGEDSESDISRHADEWIAAHQAEFDRWIGEAQKAGPDPK